MAKDNWTSCRSLRWKGVPAGPAGNVSARPAVAPYLKIQILRGVGITEGRKEHEATGSGPHQISILPARFHGLRAGRLRATEGTAKQALLLPLIVGFQRLFALLCLPAVALAKEGDLGVKKSVEMNASGLLR